MDSFPVQPSGNDAANGGDTKPMDMSTCEYDRCCGSDGFSKNGGNCDSGGHAHHYDRIKKEI